MQGSLSSVRVMLQSAVLLRPARCRTLFVRITTHKASWWRTSLWRRTETYRLINGKAMARKRNFLLSRQYLRFHLWLRHRCERLTIRQRKEIVYGLSFIYLLCSLWMIAQFFLPPKKEKLPIPTGKLTDSPIRTDSTLQELHGNFYLQHHQTIKENG